ncbi:hypothetical protein J2S00_001737 [Caldalkalibacillus uzonensis]|uniref:Spore germination protein n=1 Tax=Caldalkalibacillus uzonensis TaxID=353224 RepID=A0ABU0CRA9_9BACI|nr:spore germination protein [Caldalkalibacillus uzonensis]MDQ0338951.1 hypothetical protein [Caldalkalibacillus uzonensis]
MFTHFNRICFISVLNVSFNGTVNFGDAIHKGYAGNDQSVGGQEIFGDAFNRPVTKFDLNVVKDPDLVDQPQVQL